MSTEWLQFAALVQAVRSPMLGCISSEYREWRPRAHLRPKGALMDIKVIDENRSPIECVVSLSAEETAVLARGAWIRMARLLKTDDEHVREKVDAMFARREKAQAVAGIVMANAAHQAFDTLGVTFLLTPQFVVPDEWD